MRDHIDFLEVKFPHEVARDRAEPAGSKLFPLFPARDGSTLAKKNTVLAIRGVIERTGTPLERPDGAGGLRQRFGEHVLRVAGAQFLARSGLDLILIQLFARWGSNAVLRYVQDAPLELQGGVAIRAAAGAVKDCGRRLAEIQADVASARSADLEAKVLEALSSALEKDNVRAYVDKIVHDALVSRAASEQATTKVEELPRLFVKNKATKKVHQALVFGHDSPPESWQTFCGWQFGAAKHEVAKKLGRETNLCRDCFAKTKGEAQQPQSDSTSSASSSEASRPDSSSS